MYKGYNRLKLLSGDKLIVNENIVINHPRLGDIKEIGEETYSKFIRVFCSKPFDLAVFLYKAGVDYEEVTAYQVFNSLFQSLYYEDEEFRNVFDLFFNSEEYYNIISIKKRIEEKNSKRDYEGVQELIEELKILESSRSILIPEVAGNSIAYSFINKQGNKTVLISEELFNDLQKVVKTLTGFSNKKPVKYANKFTKEMDLESQAELAEIEEKSVDNNAVITMADLIGAVVLDTSYTYETAWDMPMYQFHSCTRMILKRDEYKNTMTGIYSGSLDPKKINMKDIYWLSDK